MQSLTKKIKIFVAKIEQGWRQAQVGWAFLRVANDFNNTALIFEFRERLQEATPPAALAAASARMRQHAGLAKMLEEHYMPPSYSLEDLARYAPGTLGYAYYRHLHDNSFEVNFFRPVAPTDDINYFALRMRQTHDVWHVLSGFSPSVADEVGLQAFYVAQGGVPFNTALVAAGLLFVALKDQAAIRPTLEAIRQGWENGLAARPLQGTAWEKLWDSSLAELRLEHNIKPVSDRFDFDPTAFPVAS